MDGLSFWDFWDHHTDPTVMGVQNARQPPTNQPTNQPIFGFSFQVIATEVVVMFRMVGLVGGPGKVDGSGVRWKTMDGLVGCSTIRAADHFVSPVSDEA